MLVVPQDFTEDQFEEFSATIRSATGQYGNDIRVQGSRVTGTARPDSDIDVAILVPPEKLDQILDQRFGIPNPGSAKERTKEHARITGKIQAGEAGLRSLRTALEARFGIEVDISIIRIGGPFDTPPYLALR